MSRVVTLVLAVGFAVVGVAGAASAHHNTISGTVACRTGGGWALTWRVVNSEQISETVTSSNRTSAVPVGTVFGPTQTRTFTETVTAKPASPLTLTLAARWTNDVTATNSGSVAVAAFSDDCNVRTVTPPTIPVVDDCGPGNAHYGQVPSGPWSSTTRPDGSIVVTANPGYAFPDGQTTVSYPAPVDSNQACPEPPATPPATPPAAPPATPPVTSPPEVLPAEVRVVRAAARAIDKCGTRSDLYKVVERQGVVYEVDGKVVHQGVWLRAKGRTITVRAHAADDTFELRGQRTWRMTFTRKACARAPEIAPDTGR